MPTSVVMRMIRSYEEFVIFPRRRVHLGLVGSSFVILQGIYLYQRETGRGSDEVTVVIEIVAHIGYLVLPVTASVRRRCSVEIVRIPHIPIDGALDRFPNPSVLDRS